MRVQITNLSCVGCYSLKLVPENGAEKFFLELLHEQDEDVFQLSNDEEGPVTHVIDIPLPYKREAHSGRP